MKELVDEIVRLALSRGSCRKPLALLAAWGITRIELTYDIHTEGLLLNDGLIKIHRAIPPRERRLTLWHELCHQILFEEPALLLRAWRLNEEIICDMVGLQLMAR